MTNSHVSCSADDLGLEARPDEILGRMTLEEKVGQMTQRAARRDYDLEAVIRAGRLGSVLSMTDVREINRLQRIAVEESRLGMPLIVGNDVIHSYRTTFPIRGRAGRVCCLDRAELGRGAGEPLSRDLTG